MADVAAHGMVRPSFVPPPPVRELRELTRYRKTQIVMRAQEIQRLDKILQDAGIKISSVASNVLGKSTRAMIEALIAGERDPAVLAEMAKARMRSKIPALTEALVGRFAAHHGAVARAVLDHIDFLDAAIARLDDEVADRLDTFQGAVSLLETIPGVGRKAAETIIAETGAEMARFPSASQLCAWAGVAPANHESAGKRRPAGTRQGGSWLRRALIQAAKAASRTKNTYLSSQYRQIAARRGPNKATVAVAHSILFAAWHMLSTGQTYDELGFVGMANQDKRRALRAQGALNPTPGKVVAEEFRAHPEFFDADDRLQVRYEMLRAPAQGEMTVAEALTARAAHRSLRSSRSPISRSAMPPLGRGPVMPVGRGRGGWRRSLSASFSSVIVWGFLSSMPR